MSARRRRRRSCWSWTSSTRIRRRACTEAFDPAEAKRLADRLEIHHTPKHGSWLNMAEIELSALGRQCLAGRIADRPTLARRIGAWQAARNAAAVTVAWRFTTADARIKLRTLYPSIDG
jgi:DDE superfamily endonuclease